MSEIAPHGLPSSAITLVANVTDTDGPLAQIFAAGLRTEAFNGGVLPGATVLPFDEDFALLLAMSANCALILSPLRSSLRASRSELSSQEMVALLTPTFLLFGQSYFWAVYGVLTKQPDIWHFNTFGAIVCLIYLALLSRGGQEQRQRERIRIHVSLFLLASVVSSVLVAFCLPIVNSGRMGLMAVAATGFSMLQSAAPLLQASEVLQTMSLQGFPLPVAFFSTISSLLWAQYAWMAKDFLYFLPNMINGVIGIFELGIVFWVAYQLASSGDKDLAATKGSFKQQHQRSLDDREPGVWMTWLRILLSADRDDYGPARYSKCSMQEPEFEPGWNNIIAEEGHCYL